MLFLELFVTTVYPCLWRLTIHLNFNIETYFPGPEVGFINPAPQHSFKKHSIQILQFETPISCIANFNQWNDDNSYYLLNTYMCLAFGGMLSIYYFV